MNWIPTSERLPEDDKRVMFDSIALHTTWIGKAYRSGTEFTEQDAAASHWMPLPEPPAMPDNQPDHRQTGEE